ncbi:MAG TPA: expansin EXLX1 family cellulose-binding protein [Ruminococcus sp.]|nr:expansin EXLX1 family cellulose-binding protein [Ruminococcus sp.]
MKKQIISLLAASAAALSAAVFPAFSAGDRYDLDGDDKVDAFDMVLARQGGLPESELAKLQSFLLGNGASAQPDTEYTIDESCILEPKGTVHTGEGTFYGGGYEGGCAMLDPVSRDYWIVAMNLADYNDAQLAGAYIQVTGELGTINMLVTDLLPEGKKGDLDLYTDAFPLIAPVEKGRVPVSWKIIPLDSAEDAPMSYKFKEGSSPFWCGVQVRNHRYPITKLEYLNDKGEFVEINRRPYNYFESMDMGPGPYTFRITDIYGQQVIDRDIPLSEDDTVIYQGHAQLPK